MMDSRITSDANISQYTQQHQEQQYLKPPHLTAMDNQQREYGRGDGNRLNSLYNVRTENS